MGKSGHFLFGALISLLILSGCQGTGTQADRLQSAFQATIDRDRQALGIPGISAAVILPDGSTWLGVSGRSSAIDQMRPDRIFGLGSVSKTYLAVLVLQLDDEGLLSVDDTVGEWLTDLGRIDGGITIRQLLNHTSGLYRYQLAPDYTSMLFLQSDRVWTPEEILAELQGPPVCRPGVCWGESAMDYVLLGLIIEKATGSTVAEQLSARLFTPLGLEHTYLYPDQRYPASEMAHMWMDLTGAGRPVDLNANGKVVPHAALFSSLWTSGAIHATAEDLARFAGGLFEGRLLEPGSLEELLAPSRDLYLGATYGFSVIAEQIDGRTVYWHSGGAGYATVYLYAPQEGISIAVLCNLMVDPYPIAVALYREYLDQ